MRSLATLVFAVLVLGTLAGASLAAAEPEVGYLSIERGRGTVVLEVRGSVLGRLTNGTITVVDRTPNDAYVGSVTGRRIVSQRRLGPYKLSVRGQGLRFRMVGGSYRIAIRGGGIALSAVGRGTVMLDGEPRFLLDDMGVYSLEEGIDCSVEPASCTPLPDEQLRVKLEAPVESPVRESR
jgi:hypothetical protein